MKCFISVSLWMVVLASAGAQMDEPTYEWSLRYMERQIPEGLRGSLDEVADYRKHKEEFNEEARISINTKGMRESMVTASSKSGILSFAVVPDGKGAICFYGAFQKDARTGKTIVKSTRQVKEIVYNREFELGSAGYVKDSGKPGQLGKGEISVFLLSVRKLDRDIPQLASDSVDPKPDKAK